MHPPAPPWQSRARPHRSERAPGLDLAKIRTRPAVPDMPLQRRQSSRFGAKSLCCSFRLLRGSCLTPAYARALGGGTTRVLSQVRPRGSVTEETAPLHRHLRGLGGATGVRAKNAQDLRNKLRCRPGAVHAQDGAIQSCQPGLVPHAIATFAGSIVVACSPSDELFQGMMAPTSRRNGRGSEPTGLALAQPSEPD